MIEIAVLSIISSSISATVGLIALRMRLGFLAERDKLRAEERESASLACSDALYRDGIEGLRVMGDVQERLLRATEPEPVRGILDLFRRPPASQPQPLPSPRDDRPPEQPGPAQTPARQQ